jgi:hypothetical protein
MAVQIKLLPSIIVIFCPTNGVKVMEMFFKILSHQTIKPSNKMISFALHLESIKIKIVTKEQ